VYVVGCAVPLPNYQLFSGAACGEMRCSNDFSDVRFRYFNSIIAIRVEFYVLQVGMRGDDFIHELFY